ncbi:hypothetical protein ABL78_0206 [Leptomonas seymouri]|uniref:Uncharacterized protein n=1 Tax=Leptomonas seymouri TaxID=5684 RepID=A0A0N1I287_LEPSE|nr:hypothetical protein ABL78_0206 [Leptomonas seymouri]|eukprot:KPI90610.1 hypothetical protein ABL78_0206 [Leptomonas seymouri]
MVSAEAKMTAARTCVVLSTAAAALCIAAIMRLPIFSLDLGSVKSSITQSLFTTDIYTPAAEKHIPVLNFTEKCEKLQTAFRVAQVTTTAAVVVLGIAFVWGVLHVAPSFIKTNHHVRWMCGAPICILLLLTITAIGIDGYIMKGMYENDTWCTSQSIPTTHHRIAVLRAAPAILLADRRTFLAPAHPIMDAPMDTDIRKCNPFDGCIASYREMGFEQAAGYEVVWAALGISVFALVVEMMVMAVGASVVPQAGITEETANLLYRQDEDRVI